MIAPGMLPSPPITVTISPLTVNGSDSSGDNMPIAAPVMAPAIPPTTPVTAKVRTFTRVMLMPQRLRCRRLLRYRASGEAEPGPIKQQQQDDHAHAAQRENEHQVAAQVERPDRDDHVGEQRRIVERNARRRMHDDLVDQQQQPDGGHQGRQWVGRQE